MLSSKVYKNFSKKKFFKSYNASGKLLLSEVTLHRCFQEKVFGKYAANLKENTHAEV